MLFIKTQMVAVDPSLGFLLLDPVHPPGLCSPTLQWDKEMRILTGHDLKCSRGGDVWAKGRWCLSITVRATERRDPAPVFEREEHASSLCSRISENLDNVDGTTARNSCLPQLQ